jgi:hypothetical protein
MSTIGYYPEDSDAYRGTMERVHECIDLLCTAASLPAEYAKRMKGVIDLKVTMDDTVSHARGNSIVISFMDISSGINAGIAEETSHVFDYNLWTPQYVFTDDELKGCEFFGKLFGNHYALLNGEAIAKYRPRLSEAVLNAKSAYAFVLETGGKLMDELFIYGAASELISFYEQMPKSMSEDSQLLPAQLIRKFQDVQEELVIAGFRGSDTFQEFDRALIEYSNALHRKFDEESHADQGLADLIALAGHDTGSAVREMALTHPLERVQKAKEMYLDSPDRIVGPHDVSDLL